MEMVAAWLHEPSVYFTLAAVVLIVILTGVLRKHLRSTRYERHAKNRRKAEARALEKQHIDSYIGGEALTSHAFHNGD
ncbi:MAG TPA: hypothetical protein VFS75_00285 [Candidatus Paceibacterota bacterium]|nr:hypothetical protein [Candidatus Paceibacterota bacterium]